MTLNHCFRPQQTCSLQQRKLSMRWCTRSVMHVMSFRTSKLILFNHQEKVLTDCRVSKAIWSQVALWFLWTIWQPYKSTWVAVILPRYAVYSIYKAKDFFNCKIKIYDSPYALATWGTLSAQSRDIQNFNYERAHTNYAIKKFAVNTS